MESQGVERAHSVPEVAPELPLRIALVPLEPEQLPVDVFDLFGGLVCELARVALHKNEESEKKSFNFPIFWTHTIGSLLKEHLLRRKRECKREFVRACM